MIKPHESISMKNRAPVKKIRIERDYCLGDGITRFSTEYPIELTGKVRISMESRFVFPDVPTFFFLDYQ
jgi:hypothetical protein